MPEYRRYRKIYRKIQSREYRYSGMFYTFVLFNMLSTAQPAFTCSNLTIEILEQGVKYVQS